MGRSPCCSKEGLNRGAWSSLEDKLLSDYIKNNGEGKWRNLPKRAGLKRCGKSCRLRWVNYLKPDIKRGNISHDEEELIIRLHNLLGNRWSLIAGRLPGRTDNEIKNYWNTTLKKRVTSNFSSTLSRIQAKKPCHESPIMITKSEAIRTKATRCTKVLLSSDQSLTKTHNSTPSQNFESKLELQNHQHFLKNDDQYDFFTLEGKDGDKMRNIEAFDEDILFNDWNLNATCFEENSNIDLDSLSFLLDYEE